MPEYRVSYHPGQVPIVRSDARFKTVVAGRRFGKTVLGKNSVLKKTFSFPRELSLDSPEIVLVTMPTRVQASGIIWEPLVSMVEKYFPGLAEINRTHYTIKFPGKPTIKVAGANDKDGDGLRGNKIWYYWGDEQQDVKPGIFESIVRPAMADCPGSTALFTGTPKGKQNGLYLLFQKAETLPDWSSWQMPTSSNPHVPRAEIEEARLTMPERLFLQEMEASFVNFPGKIFYELDESNLVDFLPESYDLTLLGVDFGDVHPCIVVLGLANKSWHVVEGWLPNTGLPVPQPVFDQNIIRLAGNYRPVQTFCDPSRPSQILGIRALGKEHNLEGLSKAIAGYNRIEEGINDLVSLIYQRKLLFARKQVDQGIPGYLSSYDIYDLFNSYRRATDKLGNVLETVAEGQNDHPIDATRYGLARAKGNA